MNVMDWMFCLVVAMGVVAMVACMFDAEEE